MYFRIGASKITRSKSLIGAGTESGDGSYVEWRTERLSDRRACSRFAAARFSLTVAAVRHQDGALSVGIQINRLGIQLPQSVEMISIWRNAHVTHVDMLHWLRTRHNVHGAALDMRVSK